MRNWTPEQAEFEVKQVLAAAARGGGFILCDGHGEIPWQVPEHVLDAVSAAALRWGSAPMDWIESENESAVLAEQE
jgi:uroporphyrinogen decarboxylase